MAQVEEAPTGGTEQFQAAYGEVKGRLRRWPFGLARRFEDLVQRVRALYAFRENSHFDLTRPLDALQSIALEWGRRLVEQGVLRQPGDVFYLTDDEVRQPPPATEAHALIARRKATYRLANSRWTAADAPAPAASGNELRGVGASGGTVRARARLVQREEEFGRLQPGEILVCPYTNPAWTPLFAAAAGVAGALERIQDGQELLVDGDRGIVTVMATEPRGT